MTFDCGPLRSFEDVHYFTVRDLLKMALGEEGTRYLGHGGDFNPCVELPDILFELADLISNHGEWGKQLAVVVEACGFEAMHISDGQIAAAKQRDRRSKQERPSTK